MKDISEDLLKRAAQGDIDAFEQVYNATSSFVFNLALRITQNSSDAEDVTQETFIKIYRNLGGFRFSSAFKTWAYRITVNTAINRYRKMNKQGKSRVDSENIVKSLPSNRKTSERIIQSDNEARLNKLLEMLTPEHKACLILRELEGLSYQEIAATLKIPVNTVRSRLRRARQALLEKARG